MDTSIPNFIKIRNFKRSLISDSTVLIMRIFLKIIKINYQNQPRKVIKTEN